ncbi:MAG: hypothetical protein IH819_09315 [Bacteroidetes bacterium]|nr:hypothetical protein [Bacteroidota bacterium]
MIAYLNGFIRKKLEKSLIIDVNNVGYDVKANTNLIADIKEGQEIEVFIHTHVREDDISLYGFDKKTKITSKGLKYSLKNISLPFGEKDSTSNISTSNSIQLKIRNGIIFIIRDFNFIKKYDLFQFD